jgi:hypothetical protein
MRDTFGETVLLTAPGRTLRSLYRPQDVWEVDNLKERRSSWPVAVLLLLPTLVWAWFSSHLVTAALSMGGAAVVLLVLVWAGRRLSRLQVTDRTVIVRTFGVARRISRDEVDRLAVVCTVEGSRAPTVNRYAIMLDRDGRALGKFSQLLYGADAVDHAIELIGTPVRRPGRQLSMADVERRFPGSFSWWRRHPSVSGLMLGLALGPAMVTAVIISQ